MIDCLWIKRGNSLVPSDPVTEEVLGNIKTGAMVRTDPPRNPRNPEFHRLIMMGLFEVVLNTYPRFADVEDLTDYLKMKSGLVDEIEMDDGRVCLRFKSISFASMDQAKFKAISEQWREIVLKEFNMDLLRDRT